MIEAAQKVLTDQSLVAALLAVWAQLGLKRAA